MCGIAGFSFSSRKNDIVFDVKKTIEKMNNSLSHRGPDAFGSWISDDKKVSLGHRRLSIIDLSDAGSQPMSSPCGRYVITYNGEIYNFLDIKNSLIALNHKFRGGSDTEVLVHAISEWGIKISLEKIIGMFSFVVYDKQNKKLLLIRDRLGIKPLYYGFINNAFVFSSELKAIKIFPNFNFNIDKNSVSKFFKFNFIPAPRTIYKNIYKLEPGKLLEVDLNNRLTFENLKFVDYWNSSKIWVDNYKSIKNSVDNYKLYEDKLNDLLINSINIRMISDVPVGAFLSGGIDSSLVVSVMQSLRNDPVKTYTVGFKEKKYNEGDYAKQISSYLGTDHREIILSPNDIIKSISEVMKMNDEPFSDCSIIPTYFVSKLAKEAVSVCLSGDGGDELFAGYGHYRWAQRFKIIEKVPLKIRSLIDKILLENLKKLNSNSTNSNQKINNLSNLINKNNLLDVYEAIVCHDVDTANLLLQHKNFNEDVDDLFIDKNLSNLNQMMLWDISNYLPNDILTKLDSASMAVSLEARVPMLDHRIFDFASRLNSSFTMNKGNGKIILKNLLYKYLPKRIVDKPKMVFDLPLEYWLKNELKDWSIDLLNAEEIKKQGILNFKYVETIWNEFLSGHPNWFRVWNILIFQLWARENKVNC